MSRVNSKIKIISATFYIKITLQGCLAIYELLTRMTTKSKKEKKQLIVPIKNDVIQYK